MILLASASSPELPAWWLALENSLQEGEGETERPNKTCLTWAPARRTVWKEQKSSGVYLLEAAFDVVGCQFLFQQCPEIRPVQRMNWLFYDWDSLTKNRTIWLDFIFDCASVRQVANEVSWKTTTWLQFSSLTKKKNVWPQIIRLTNQIEVFKRAMK